MPKVKVSSIPKKERMKVVGDFFDVVHGLKTKSDTIDFLVGLLTSSESLMLARRIQVARQLIKGKTYDEIRKKIKVSYQTINGVEQWMNARDGAYKKILLKWMKREQEKIQRTTRGSKSSRRSYGNLLDRYPQHRFLKDLLGL